MRRVPDNNGVKWAGELQDGTMQSLAALRMLLASAINDNSREALAGAADQAIRQLEDEIGDLRVLIGEMRGHGRHPQQPFGRRQTTIKPRSSA